MPVTLRGLVRFLFICVIMNIHHRQRATRLSHSSFLYLLISTISDNIFIGILGVVSMNILELSSTFSRGFYFVYDVRYLIQIKVHYIWTLTFNVFVFFMPLGSLRCQVFLCQNQEF